MQEQTPISQRRACFLVGLSRASFHYRSTVAAGDSALTERISELPMNAVGLVIDGFINCCDGKESM